MISRKVRYFNVSLKAEFLLSSKCLNIIYELRTVYTVYAHMLYFLFDMCYYVFICDIVDLPLFVVVKAQQSLCCVIFHIYTTLKIPYSVPVSVAPVYDWPIVVFN